MTNKIAFSRWWILLVTTWNRKLKIELWTNQKQTDNSARVQSIGTKTIYIDSIRIISLYHDFLDFYSLMAFDQLWYFLTLLAIYFATTLVHDEQSNFIWCRREVKCLHLKQYNFGIITYWERVPANATATELRVPSGIVFCFHDI